VKDKDDDDDDESITRSVYNMKSLLMLYFITLMFAFHNLLDTNFSHSLRIAPYDAKYMNRYFLSAFI
jgi:hypothetical protein